MFLTRALVIPKIVSLFALAVCFTFSTSAQQNQDFSRWAQHNPQEASAVNHVAMSNILTFLTVKKRKSSNIAYSRVSGKVKGYVSQYRQYLEGLPVSLLNKNEQLAFWLNLHNVTVIELLSENKRNPKKVKKLRGSPSNPGKAWLKPRVKVEGVSLSLQDIEQKVLMQHFSDPLIIYGLFYGTKGSPDIGTEAFSGEKVKSQLSHIAKQFIGNKKNVKVKKNQVQVSNMYTWNKRALFAGQDAQLIQHLQQHAGEKSAQKLSKVTLLSDKQSYNWASNAYKEPRQSNLGGSGGGGGYGSGS